MNKKILTTLLITIMIFTIGCGNISQALTDADYNLSNNTTSKGVAIGSTSDDFVNAYDGFEVSVIYSDNSSNTGTFMNIDKVDYSKQGIVAIQNFFIDDKAYTIDEIKSKYDIGNDMNTWLQDNSDFLEKHTLTYKCLSFYFDNGTIIDIQYSEKNYNE